MARLREKYRNEAMAALKERLGYTSTMQIPKITKIVVNIGVGEAIQDIKKLEAAQDNLEAITGQKSVQRRSKKAVANFKLREGMPIGCSVTLRGDRMYEFLDRLLNVALPRVRDFRGVSRKATDGKGNYTLGIKEQIIFPEIDYDKIDRIRGMNITIVTSAQTDEEALALLEEMGMPFVRKPA